MVSQHALNKDNVNSASFIIKKFEIKTYPGHIPTSTSPLVNRDKFYLEEVKFAYYIHLCIM